MMKSITLALLLAFLSPVSAQVEVVSKRATSFSEPSDVLKKVGSPNFWVLGDKSTLFECSPSGDVVTSFLLPALDVEAVTCSDRYCYLSEETLQRILVMDATTMKELYSVPLHHGGGRNQGVEAMTWLSAERVLLVSTEKDPQFFMELDEQLQVQKTYRIEGIHEVSALTFSEGRVYVLSDEDATIFRLTADHRSVEQSWNIPIINPEGLCAKGDGSWIVVSDDGAMWYELKGLKP